MSSTTPIQSLSYQQLDNSCAVCNQLDCHYTLTAQFIADHTFLALQSPVCGDDQCIQSIRSNMLNRITRMYGDDVLIEFYVNNNNDDPFQ